MNTKKPMARCSHRPATRIASLILSLAMLFTLTVGLDFSAFAEDIKYVEGYYTYTVTDGKATIVSCDSKISGDVVIPSTLGGYPVANLRNGFFFCDEMTSVTLPKSIESLEGNVFDDCEKLKNIFVYKYGTNKHQRVIKFINKRISGKVRRQEILGMS